MTKKTIEFAPAIRVDTLRLEVDALLQELAWLFKDPDESPDDWLQYVFVSDESRLDDFLSTDSELQELRQRLALPEIKMLDSLCDVAVLFDQSKVLPTIH
jgi:hypothetical protein